MSTDYRDDETLTVETFQFGVTCLGCHAPHDTPGDDNPKIADVSAVCKGCHNAHLEEGMAEFEAGGTARHPSKEMMAGLGAVGVVSTPSKHDMACDTCATWRDTSTSRPSRLAVHVTVASRPSRTGKRCSSHGWKSWRPWRR